MFELFVDEAVEDPAVEPFQEDRYLLLTNAYHEQPLEQVPLEAWLVEALKLAADASVVELLMESAQVERRVYEDGDEDVLQEVIVGFHVKALQHAGVPMTPIKIGHC